MNGRALRAVPLICAIVLAVSAAHAFAVAPTRVRAAVTPATAQLGERVLYRGTVVLPGGAGPSNVRWSAPGSDDVLTWGAMTPRYVRGVGGGRTGDAARGPAPVEGAYDTAFVEIPLQVFGTGVVTIPGLTFEIQEGSSWVPYRLPVVRMPIVPVLTAADSSADLRPLRGPLAAPWWERVPWLWVVAALLLIAVAILVWRRMRRRRPAPAPKPLHAPVETPAMAALRELAALRRLRHVEEGRYADHAFALTRILKRFLEQTQGAPRPGDTTPEFVRHLADAALDADEVRRIGELLRYWDRLKFARGETAEAEARAAESAVEALVRAAGRPAAGAAA